MDQAVLRPSTYCPAARLAREAAALIVHLEGVEAVTLERPMNAVDRLDALGDAATYVQAESQLGAYFQVLLAIGSADPEALGFARSREGSRTARRVKRLMASVVGFLGAPSEAAAAAALASYYTRPDDLQLLT